MDANQEAEIDAKIEVNDHLANASGSDLPTQIFPADVHELSDHFEHGLHVDASACDGPIKDTPTEYDEIELSVTESQYSAIVHPPEMNQILRIRAGPGSGKTFTLVARIFSQWDST
ncbi:hypothetical protein JCM33374_g6533 [Metschnikowia sp. JCM 33374]|nr:hypothetical protein JCM33374_g6533 [Metschnikowia sp. JCM 33374]